MILDSSLFHVLHRSDISLFAQASTSTDVVVECLKGWIGPDNAALNCSGELSKYTSDQWDGIWNLKVAEAGAEFRALMNISRYIAGPAVVLWGVEAIKDLHRNGIAEGWQRMAAVIILVFVLYSNDAEVMRRTTLAMRSLVNYQNEQVLELTNESSQFETKLAEITDFKNSENIIRELRSQCDGKTSNDELLACLEEANESAQKAISDYRSQYSASDRWAQSLEDFKKGAIEDPIGTVASATTKVALPLINPAVGAVSGFLSNSGATLATNGILAGMNYFTQNVIEMAWLFTAVIVPIPLALAFYPGSKGALIGWVIGFLMIGLFKINMNIASSLIVSMIYERGPGAGSADLMLLSVGVIAVASLMTAGGGYVLFSGIMSATTALALGAVRLGASAASGGIVK
ncbi:MAG: hypothetical protein WA947_08435 [Phormidesmis sp.]